jgi:hypothetical protein
VAGMLLLNRGILPWSSLEARVLAIVLALVIQIRAALL